MGDDGIGLHRELRATMRGLTAIALLAVAIGAIMHFWPSGERPPMAPSASTSTSYRDSSGATSDGPASAQPPTSAALSPGRAGKPGTLGSSPVASVRIDVRTPDRVRLGDTFPVTIDAQAPQGIRQLAFAVTYKKSILELVGSSAGAFAQQGGTSVQFEEPSDGYLLVRIDLESGVIAGAGGVAVLEFRAARRGVSPLSIDSVTYVERGRDDTATMPMAHEGSITVD